MSTAPEIQLPSAGVTSLAIGTLRNILGLLFSLPLVVQPGYGQQISPTIQWQRSFGGTSDDVLFAMEPTTDGGWVVGGSSLSGTNGNKTSPNHGREGVSADFWVVRLDGAGTKLWDKTYGGSSYEDMFALRPTADGGFILGGYSASEVSGNKSAPRRGEDDFWVVKLDANGGMVWDASFGGIDFDGLYSLDQTSDGGYILGGYSASGANGNKTAPNLGKKDYWVVRLDAQGNKLWDRTYGGSGDDTLYFVLQTADGGFILAGYSDSPADGTKTSPHFGGYDFWIVRLDGAGNQIWDKTYGGTDDDGLYFMVIKQTPDGGFIVGGDSWSVADGNKTSANFGEDDFWVLRLNANGDKVWEGEYGGADFEELTDIIQTADGGFLLGGLSDSGKTGNKTGVNYGLTDFWVVQLDATGNKLWDQTYGGSSQDAYYNVSLRTTPDGGLFLGGDSSSDASGIKTSANFGGADYWVLKLNISRPPTLRAPPQTNIVENGFRLFLSGESNQLYVVEKSLSLQAGSWQPISTNQVIGAEVEVTDSTARTNSRAFYRARHVF